ncbi:MAG TPA: DUF255 domain-containing protein [Chitinophagales bacterium]|nr:DUF255 domain-containing protein [Chitinophagales bacterium]
MIAQFVLSAFLFFSPEPQVQDLPVALTDDAVKQDTVSWMSLADVNKVVEKNIKKNKVKEEKLILVDFYTDWCGWCKKLDIETYTNAEVVRLMNTYFYSVKFDAESTDSVQFANKSYAFIPRGSRGTNGFAVEMATRPGGRIGYPTMTIISPLGEKIAVEGGYKDPAKMTLFLMYYGEGHYKTKDFNTFQAELRQKELTD